MVLRVPRQDPATRPPSPITDKTSKCIHILKTIGKLNDASTNPEIMALKAHVDEYAKTTTTVFNAIATNLGKTNHQPHQPSQRPPWFSHPPTEPNQTHEHDGCTWHWRHKCNASRGGRWVCTHTADTHRDSYTPSNKRKSDNCNMEHKNEEQQVGKRQNTTASPQAAAYLSNLSDLLPEDKTNTPHYPDEILDW
jgi:hypothetical protein